MKNWLNKVIALIMVLALFVPAISSAEELGEVDLYAPEVYDGTVAEEAQAPETSEEAPMSAEAPADAEVPISADEPAADTPAVYAVAAPEAYPASLLLGAKEKYTLNGLVLSGGQPVTYVSSNPKLVTVDANGLVTAKKAGGAEITCCLGETPLAVCAVTVAKAPKKVTLPAKSVVLGLGEWRAFGATLPEGSAGAVSYTSDNPAVLVVDEAGNIGGAGPGTAKLTATAYNGKKATCAVQVLNGPSPTWVSLSQSEATMMAKGTLQLYAGYDAGCDAILGYSTSDKKIATVDGNGFVTAKKGGQATVTVTTHNGLTASCLVTVYTAPKKVSLSAKKLTLNVGEGAQLTAAITANSVTELTWSTSDAAVAAVDGNGYVYATGAGKATVTVTTTNGKKAKCSVKVNGPAVPSAPKKVTLNAKKATLNVGEGYQLVATLPANSVSDLTWSTSNAAVAVVDANGYVTVVGPGKATITVVTVNGKKASFKVTVKGESTPTTPSGRIELADYLGVKFSKIRTALGFTGYSNGQIWCGSLGEPTGPDSAEVFCIESDPESKYCIYGLYLGMPLSDADSFLYSNGWQFEDDYSSLFDDPSKTYALDRSTYTTLTIAYNASRQITKLYVERIGGY